MLTVGEHDEMWKDVMGRRIPTIDSNIRILTNQIGHMNQLNLAKELHNMKIISDSEYAKALLSLGRKNAIYIWETDEEENKYRKKVDEMFGNE